MAAAGLPEAFVARMRELLGPEAAAFLDSYGRPAQRAVDSLAADPERTRQMGLAGRARAVEEFGWDAVAARTVELYESLL